MTLITSEFDLGRYTSWQRHCASRFLIPQKPKPGDVWEMADGLTPLRIVIQQLGIFAVPSYRVIVYSDEFKPRHTDFDSPAALLEILEAAIPELDLSQLRLNPLEEGQGSIVFDGELLLSDQQLSGLRLGSA